MLVTGEDLSAILDLSWKDTLTVNFKRIRSGIRKSKQLTPSLAAVLLAARKVKPMMPRWHVLRLEDGNELTVREFHTLWRLYMQRWVKRGKKREAFSIEDVRRTIVAQLSDGNSSRMTGHRIPRLACRPAMMRDVIKLC
jgi:hypothetical protein